MRYCQCCLSWLVFDPWEGVGEPGEGGRVNLRSTPGHRLGQCPISSTMWRRTDGCIGGEGRLTRWSDNFRYVVMDRISVASHLDRGMSVGDSPDRNFFASLTTSISKSLVYCPSVAVWILSGGSLAERRLFAGIRGECERCHSVPNIFLIFA